MKKLTLIILLAIIGLSINVNAQWQQTSLDSGLVTCFAISGHNIFVGSANGGGVHLSSDNGNSWTAVNNGLTDTNVYALAIKGNNIFAGGGGVFLSTNNGSNWVSTGLLDTPIVALAINDTNIFAGIATCGVVLSTNNGSSWTMTGLTMSDPAVSAFAIKGDTIFAGTSNGVFLSSNNGSNWTAVNNGLPGNAWVIAFAIKGSNIFAGTLDYGAYLSTDNGNSWTAVNTGLPSPPYSNISALVISGSNIFAGTSGSGVFLSSNNGSSWAAVNTGLSNLYINALAISGDTLFAGTDTGGVWKRALSQITGIEEINNNESNIKAYPNPAKDNITIETPHQATIEILNIEGQIIKTITTAEKQTSIDVSDLADGVYIIKAKTEKGVAVKKFVKE